MWQGWLPVLTYHLCDSQSELLKMRQGWPQDLTYQLVAQVGLGCVGGGAVVPHVLCGVEVLEGKAGEEVARVEQARLARAWIRVSWLWLWQTQICHLPSLCALTTHHRTPIPHTMPRPYYFGSGTWVRHMDSGRARRIFCMQVQASACAGVRVCMCACTDARHVSLTAEHACVRPERLPQSNGHWLIGSSAILHLLHSLCHMPFPLGMHACGACKQAC